MLKKFLSLVIIAVVLVSCELGDSNTTNCPVIIGVSATAVSGPTETAVNVPIDLLVSYKTRKNCGSFSSFFNNKSANHLVDIITVNSYYNPCSCDQVESIATEIYKFKKDAAGIYTVKFRNTNELFVEHTVTVQ